MSSVRGRGSSVSQKAELGIQTQLRLSVIIESGIRALDQNGGPIT